MNHVGGYRVVPGCQTPSLGSWGRGVKQQAGKLHRGASERVLCRPLRCEGFPQGSVSCLGKSRVFPISKASVVTRPEMQKMDSPVVLECREM